MVRGLRDCIFDHQQLMREEFSGFSMKFEQKMEKTASRFPETAKFLLENQFLSWKEKWSSFEASRQQSRQDYRRNGSYSGKKVDINSSIRGRSFSYFIYRCTSVR